MKKYSFLFVFAVLASVMISCSNDDTASNDDVLVGTWKLTSLTVETPVLVEGVPTSNFTQIASDSQIKFNANSLGTMQYLTGLGYDSQTVNNDLVFMQTSSFGLYEFKFVLNNNVVTIFDDNNKTLSLLLDGNTLTLYKEGGIVLGNLDNDTVEQVKTKYVFKKQ